MNRFRRVLPLVAITMTASLVTCTTSSPTSSVQPGVPSPTQIVAPSPLATPSPTASPALTSASPKPVPKPMPIARPLTWTAQVSLVTYNPTLHSVAVTILDSRGVRLLGSFRLTLTRVVNPPPVCLSGPCPPPPTTFVDRYSGCCTTEYMPLNMNWGGKWSIRGSVTYGGVTKSVSGSGAIR